MEQNKNIDNQIKTYLKRIARNKVRIGHHKIYIAMTITLLLILSLVKTEFILNNFTFIMLLLTCLILGDIAMIAYHKWWIKKWRRALTEITGANYDKLDSIDNEIISEEEFNTFCDKHIKSDEELQLILNNDDSFSRKMYLFAINILLKDYCETRGILNSSKIEDLPYLKNFYEKRQKKLVKDI